MAMFVPPVIGGVVAGTAAYQAWNPAKKQAPESKNAPRNGQDWRLGPTTDNLKLSDYWRNHVNRPSQPIEEAYRSTYNNIYTNAPKLMADEITGQPRWISPDGNSTNSGNDLVIVLCVLMPCSDHRPSRLRAGDLSSNAAGGQSYGKEQKALRSSDQVKVVIFLDGSTCKDHMGETQIESFV
jgi:hypothetical protein